ncbi:hypothetical protein ECZU23_02240 [Escherichia coli]|nr:hypothetical protein ECZU03_05830 [Escherichia coli]GHK38056.1 hypothetical protein ECZU06_51810 [Escherichia coli]GHK84248.1 hypothetical protein ECZU17_01850 [Escherichia coli]GHK95546.1 hypothetical protein ECZU20_02960 [Escherichia coli]GHL02594.1 hypothetical protein ECZU21_16070 [Escherichia coli]
MVFPTWGGNDIAFSVLRIGDEQFRDANIRAEFTRFSGKRYLMRLCRIQKDTALVDGYAGTVGGGHGTVKFADRI